tara:strand:- start:540 stop:872 length:333 start_codon:yes stop_codon:yes gene_type:complete
MSDKRTLEYDALTKTKTSFVFEESSSGREAEDTVVIQTEQDVTQIVEDNKRKRNEIDRHQRYGEWNKVASIPLSVLHLLDQQGITKDKKRFKAWLNDPDNRAFRTRGGRV